MNPLTRRLSLRLSRPLSASIPLFLAMGALAFSLTARGETPQSLLQRYRQDAASQQSGFQPSAARGKAFYQQRFTASPKLPACATCHTANPRGNGEHAITGKTIQPLAPAAHPERFTDTAKVEKWFRRNCNEVVGRECSSQEKADLIAYLMEAPAP